MKRINVEMPEELWDSVKKAAAKISFTDGETVSASEFVRRACDERVREVLGQENDRG